MLDKTAPLVSIVILNYNGRQLLERFLPSVINLNYPNKEIIVVDNASSDKSIGFLRNNYPQLKVIINKENFGTAEGSNIGARQSCGEFIFFMSNDMELEPNMLTLMVERMSEDGKIGICTCKMRRITEEGQKLNIIDSVGAEVDIFGFPSARGINEMDEGQYDYPKDVFFSFGGAMLIRSDIFKLTGGYDAHTFTLGDDIDLSWRAHLLNYRVVVEPKACLYHRVSATLGTIYGRSHKRFLSEKNTLMALLKNYSFLTLVLIMPAYFIILFSEISFFLLLGKIPLVLSLLKAVGQTFRELPDILEKRNKVQSQRKINDIEILKLMRKGSHKIGIFFDFIKNRGRGLNWDSYFGELKKS